MASWLDEDPQVAEFLRRYQLSQEQERALKMQKLSDFGFGMMGARKGQELQAVGRAGLLAGEGYRRNRESAQQENMSRLQMTQYAQRMAEQERARAASADMQQQVGNVFAAPQSPLSAMGAGGPTPQNAERVDQARAVNPRVAQYRQLADLYASKNQMELAAKASAIADKLESGDDYDTTVRVGTGADGPYNYLVNKRGSERRLGAGVAPDNQVVQLGDRAQVVDKLRTPAGTSLAYGQSPDSKASNAVQWANYGLSKDRLKYDREQAARGPAGQYDAALGMIVDTRAGTARPVVGPDGQPLARPDKPLSETQGKVTALANQMQEATKVIAELAEKKFTGKTLSQQVASSLAGSKGVPYTLGTAAIPKMIAGPDAQKYRQAELQWSEAMLRFLTGAAAPDSEVARNADTYFPRPGDTPEVVKQKEDMRAASERSVRLAAGKAGNAQLPAMPAAGRSTAPSIDELVKKYAP
jgi:hypothetical protein